MKLGAALGTMVARGFVLTASLATGIITARALGPEGRGQYFALTTLSAILAQVGNLGMTSSNVFLGAKDSRAAWPLLVNSGWLASLVAILAAIAVMLFGSSIAASLGVPAHLLWAVCLLAPAVLFFTLACSVLISEERFAAVNGWQIINAFLTLALLGGAAMIGRSVESFVFATTCAALITVITLAAFAGAGRFGQLAFRADMFVAGWKFASRAYLVLLLGFLMQRSSVAILMKYGTAADIGMYSIASQIFDVLVIVPSSVAMVIFPSLVKRPDGRWGSIRTPLFTTTGAMLLICALVAVLAHTVIALVFGTAFVPAAALVLLLMPAVIFTTVTTVLSQFVVSKQFPASLIAVWVAGILLMAITAVLLAPARGAAGVAIAQSIGSAVVCAGVLVLTQRQIAVTKIQ